MLPAENATGNFTKIVQRVPVRIVLDGEASTLRPAAAWTIGERGRGPVGHVPRRAEHECRDVHRSQNAVPQTRARAAQPLSPDQIPMATKVLAFAAMCIGMFIALLDIQIVSASLREIGGGLSAGNDETAWVQTSYLIAEIIVIPLSGWLSRVMSTRWLFCVSAVGLHLVEPAVRLAAWDIHSMIVFRALQGFLGGSMIPTVFTTAFIVLPRATKIVVIGRSYRRGHLLTRARRLGPTVGGWITDNYSWHWLFFVNLVPGAFSSPSSCRCW